MLIKSGIRHIYKVGKPPILFIFDHSEEAGHVLKCATTACGHLYASAPEWIYGSVSSAPWVSRLFSNFRGKVGTIVCVSSNRRIIQESHSMGVPVFAIMVKDPMFAAETAAKIAYLLRFLSLPKITKKHAVK